MTRKHNHHHNIFSLIAGITLSCMLSSCIPAAIGAGAAAGASLVQERSVGNAVDDTAIWTKIKSALFQKDVNHLFGSVHVKVSEGRVLLSGNVPSHDAKIEAARLTWEQPGVKEVINDITVEVPTGKLDIAEYSNDSWITTQIRAKMLVNKHIRSVNYTVDTRHGVVHIMGIAQSPEELETVTTIVRSISGVQKVMNYARLKDSPIRGATKP